MEFTKCVIIASPGFVKDNFENYCNDMSLKEEFKDFK